MYNLSSSGLGTAVRTAHASERRGNAVPSVFDDIQFYLFNHHHYIDIP